jgi:hypothetical protein
MNEKNSTLVGHGEIAKMGGVSVSAVTNWSKRYPDWPEPIRRLAMGPIYHRQDIVDFLGRHPTLGKRESQK